MSQKGPVLSISGQFPALGPRWLPPVCQSAIPECGDAIVRAQALSRLAERGRMNVVKLKQAESENMSALYFDCFSGISGDMILGALLDLGLPLEFLSDELEKLNVRNFRLKSHRVRKSGVVATKFDVETGEDHHHRHYATIEKIIRDSELSPWVQDGACRAFRRLAEAEAKVHGTTMEKVHFHEVGAIDAIVDIVGAFVGLEGLGVQQCLASPLNVGRGTVDCAHGRMPVPAPATAELLRGLPIYSNQIDGELVTPTGAAILTTVCRTFGELPGFRIEKVGHGAGSREIEGSPNVLRVLKGERIDAAQASSDSKVLVLEANIDDMNPQIFGYVQRKLFELGVHDVFYCPVQMKKNRPGVLLTVVLPSELLNEVCRVLFQETTTLGVRYQECRRKVLVRAVEPVDSEFGRVSVKVARLDGKMVSFSPEYEDCQVLARRHQVPYKRVQWQVIQEFMNQHGKELG